MPYQLTVQRNLNYINVKDYGATGNGTTDDSAAITAAIAAIPSTGGTVIFPLGKYKTSGISLSNLTDVSLLGVGTGSILLPTSGATAISISGGTRCHVRNLKIDGNSNTGAIGLSISGDYDARFQNLQITGLSGDAIYVQGDAAIGNEMHFSHVTCRANAGWAYHHVRTTTNDRGGMYFDDFLCIYDTQGSGGIFIDASGAASTVGVFHFFSHCAIDNYVGGPSVHLNNVHHTRFVQLWASGTNSGGASILFDGDGYMNDIDQCYLYNGGTTTGSYNIALNGTQHDNMLNLIEFDGSPIAHVHVGSSGANTLLGFYNIFGSTQLTDTSSALYSRGTTVQTLGPLTINAPGSGTSSSFGIADPTHTGNEKWIRNSNGSLQILNTAFSSTIFRVDDGGFTFAGGGIMPFGNNTGACTLYSGSGTPGSGLGSNGDYYFRSDTAATPNQQMYIKSSGSWIGVSGPSVEYNVKQYGAKGDGSTDDTTAIAAAISAANTAGGGTVRFPPGTYVTGNQTIYANIHYRGAGIQATIIQLKAGANADLFSAQTSSINLSQTINTGSAGSVYNFGFYDLTLDGNKANQTAGPSYPLRFYAYGYIMQNIRVKNGYTGGILSDWNGGSSSPGQDAMEAQWINMKCHDNNGIGLQFGGPHDSQFMNIISYSNGSHCFHFAPNCPGIQVTNAHAWGPATGVTAVCFLIEPSLGLFTNCVAEGADTTQVILLGAQTTWSGGLIFGAGTFTVSGIQVGQNASLTPIPSEINQSGGVTTAVSVGGCFIQTNFSRCEGTNGTVYFVNDGGNVIYFQSYQTAGNCYTGSPASTTILQAHVTGLTADGTQGKGGTFLLPINAFSAITVSDNAGTNVFNLNTNVKRFEVPNGCEFRGYSDAYSTIKFQLNPDGNGSIVSKGSLSVGPSSSTPTLSSSGTISTSGISASKVTTSGAVTGVILQAGTIDGQIVVVENTSGNSITFAAAATSNVLDGTSDVIAANNARGFIWNSTNSRWSPMK